MLVPLDQELLRTGIRFELRGGKRVFAAMFFALYCLNCGHFVDRRPEYICVRKS
jgi:hypothetical protein